VVDYTYYVIREVPPGLKPEHPKALLPVVGLALHPFLLEVTQATQALPYNGRVLALLDQAIGL